MPRPVRLRVAWMPQLYGPELTQGVNAALNSDPTTKAIINTVKGVASFGRLERSLRLYGAERLAKTERGLRIIKAQPGLLGHLPGHDYSSALPYPDDGPGYRVFLHRKLVLILPEEAKTRRTRAGLEDYFSSLVLERPVSAHARLLICDTLTDIAEEAGALLDYVWPHGITPADGDGIIPAGMVMTSRGCHHTDG